MEMVRLARSARWVKKCLFDGAGYSSVSDQSRIKPRMLYPSLSLNVDDNYKYFNCNIPGVAKTESDERLSCLFLNMHGLKKEHVKVSVNPTRSVLSIQGQKYDESCYHAFMSLPENVHMNAYMIEAKMLQDGMFEVTLPKLKDTQVKNTNFFTNIYYRLRFKLALRFYSSIPSVILAIARPFVINFLCPRLHDSFTMYKKETANSLHVNVTSGIQKMDYMSGGVCISLNMPEIRIEDVKLFYKYDTLFIHGKTKTKENKVVYVTGIRVPNKFARKRSMIKEEKQDGMYKATIPFVTN